MTSEELLIAIYNQGKPVLVDDTDIINTAEALIKNNLIVKDRTMEKGKYILKITEYGLAYIQSQNKKQMYIEDGFKQYMIQKLSDKYKEDFILILNDLENDYDKEISSKK